LKTLEECYQFAADVIFACVPEPWSEAWLDVEVTSDWGQFTGDYITTQGETKWFDPGFTYRDHSLLDVFEQMSLLMKLPDHEPWNKCRFHLTPEGIFQLDVFYLDPSELGKHPDYPDA
jgi:hypothetical protein